MTDLPERLREQATESQRIAGYSSWSLGDWRHSVDGSAKCLREAADEVERLSERQQSDERQLVDIAAVFGKDARHVKGDDKSIAGLVREEVERLRAMDGVRDHD